jgi:hypothetical protein
VWSDINPVHGMYQFEIDVLKDLFVLKEQEKKTPQQKKPEQDVPSTPGFQIVNDLTRANNIAIMLKSFSSFGSPSAIKDAILQGSDDLSERHLEQLRQMAPRPQEIEAIDAFTGKPSDLHLPEQFLIKLASIPRLERKLNVLLFKKQFGLLVSGAIKGMDALNCSCQQIRQSQRLKRVFGSILASGNVLNENTVRGGANAIKIESILSLADVKVVTQPSGSNEMPIPKLKTFLEFIAWKVMCEEYLHGHSTIEEIKKCAYEGYLFQDLGILGQAVLLVESDARQNVDALEKGMNLVQKELNAERRPSSASQQVASRQATFESTLNAAAGIHPGDDNASGHQHSSFFCMLQRFDSEAQNAIEQIRVMADQTNTAQEEIVGWMGERGNLDAPELLKSILRFSRDFDSSFSKVFNLMGSKKLAVLVEYVKMNTA